MSKSTAFLARQTSLSDLRIPRRKFMTGAAAVGMALGSVAMTEVGHGQTNRREQNGSAAPQ
jgi:hypothetical protein